jgi:hypothetical protein
LALQYPGNRQGLIRLRGLAGAALAT